MCVLPVEIPVSKICAGCGIRFYSFDDHEDSFCKKCDMLNDDKIKNGDLSWCSEK